MAEAKGTFKCKDGEGKIVKVYQVLRYAKAFAEKNGLIVEDENGDIVFGVTKEEVQETVEELAEETVEASKSITNTVVDEVKEAADEIGDSVKENVSDIVEDVKDAVEDAVDKISDKICEEGDDFVEIMEKAPNIFKRIFAAIARFFKRK